MKPNSSIITAPILVLEDEPVIQTLIGGILNRMGLDHHICSNGKEGLKALDQGKYSIYIVDLLMPEMDGKDFILELRKQEEQAVVLVETTINIPETIVEVMKNRVFDYIFKPFDTAKFQQSVLSALDYHKYILTQKERSSQISLKLRSQLDWLNYKEQRRNTDSTAQERNLIYNLKTSMSQGAGIGTMITMMDLVEANMKKQESDCIVSCEIMDLIFKNLDISKRMIDGIISISDILDSNVQLTRGKFSELVKIIHNLKVKLDPILEQKNIRFTTSELPHDYSVEFHRENITDILEELIVNAIKYSPVDGELSCYFHFSDGFIVTSIKNDVDVKSGGHGVPPEYEKIVTEPFIRLATPDESVLHIEKFSIGLGLSVVEHVARSHNGHFFIRNVVDHLRAEPVTCVLAELLLPVEMD